MSDRGSRRGEKSHRGNGGGEKGKAEMEPVKLNYFTDKRKKGSKEPKKSR